MVERDVTEVSAARESGLSARLALSATERSRRSSVIADLLADLPELRHGRSVAAYMATGAEVDLDSLWEVLAAAGVRLHLPRIATLESPGAAAGDPPDRSMDFVPWERGNVLTPNRYGISEPDGNAVAVSDLDAVVLPCVAVDDLGNRVGFGAGYYDRALGGLDRDDGAARPRLIGVAFDNQRCDAIAAQPWDVSVDVVVTDLVVLRPAGDLGPQGDP